MNYVVHDTDTGGLVSIGTIIADPLPEGLTAVQVTDLEYDGLIEGSLMWDGTAVVANPAYAATQTAETNLETLTDVSNLEARIANLKVYRADSDVVATAAQVNNSLPTAAQLNRYNKATIRGIRRLENAVIALMRASDPALLQDISDTTGE